MGFEFLKKQLLQADRKLNSTRKDCYCAFCKSPRKIYTKRRINLFNILGSVFASVLVMYTIFQGFDPRVMLIFVVLLAISEVFVQFKWRVAIVCQHCGFDPVLYLKDSIKASEKVKIKLAQRKKDPASLFGPALNIATITKKKEEVPPPISKAAAAAAAKKGQRLSKQV